LFLSQTSAGESIAGVLATKAAQVVAVDVARSVVPPKMESVQNGHTAQSARLANARLLNARLLNARPMCDRPHVHLKYRDDQLKLRVHVLRVSYQKQFGEMPS
jgi:hypothetical protein